ncbi:MAG: hypothetical protein HYU57_02785 [Micavibrio aeruginosavorus]|nr:hypothetical protein [Micavibrio aeruginosavorus]
MRIKTKSGLGVLVAILLMGGCDSIVYNVPTEVTDNRAEVYRSSTDFEIKTSDLGEPQLQKIAQDYRRYGETPMQVTVTYDPVSQVNTARRASEAAARISDGLRAQGVRAINIDTMPVQALGDGSTTLVSYDALEARAPSGCESAIDMDFATFKQADDYKLGCSIETHLAKQVTRPKDLMGSDHMDNAQGRYTANSLERYMVGDLNEPIAGEVASEGQ